MSDVVRDALAEMLAEQTQLVALRTGDLGYGVDLVCFDDLMPGLDETYPSTVASLAQDNYHRLITDAGSLPDDLDYGNNITRYLSRGTTERELLAMRGEIETELLKDDRNAQVSAAVVVSGLLPTKFSITIAVTPDDPDLDPFKLILQVTPDGALFEALQ